MKKPGIIALIVVIVIAVVVGIVFASKNNNKTTTTPAPAPSPSSATPTPSPAPTSATPPSSSTPEATGSVAIQDFAFTPKTVTVKKGTTVTWTNKDSAEHTVTADSGDGPKSGTLAQGQTYSFTFNNVGTFSYHCSFHSYMTGTVTVTD
jgi:plastocyanin